MAMQWNYWLFFKISIEKRSYTYSNHDFNLVFSEIDIFGCLEVELSLQWLRVDHPYLCARFGQLWCANNYLGNLVDVQTLLQRCLQLGGITPYQSQRQHDFLDSCLHTKVALRWCTTSANPSNVPRHVCSTSIYTILNHFFVLDGHHSTQW